MLFDTDVLIWFLRGNTNAREKVLAESPFKISAVTYMELVQGMRNGQELAALNRAVEPLCTANDKHYKSIPGIALDVFRP